MSNSKWAPEDKPRPVVKQTAKTSIRLTEAPVTRITKEEALSCAKLYFEKFAGFTFPTPLPDETTQQYASRVNARLNPMMTAAMGVRDVIKRSYA